VIRDQRPGGSTESARGSGGQGGGDAGEGVTHRGGGSSESSPELAGMALRAANATRIGFGVKLEENRARQKPHRERRRGDDGWRRRTAVGGAPVWSR
jgi:hypothetical protein